MKVMDKSKSEMRWSKSVTNDKGVTRSVNVRQIHNGFIARIEQYGGDNDYMEKEIYFAENPLKDVEPVLDADVLSDFLNPKTQLL